MAKIRKTMGLDRIGIESLPVPEEVKQYLRKLTEDLELMHRNLRETAESLGKGFGAVTIDLEAAPDWRIKQVGSNLEFQKRDQIRGTYYKKAAITG